MKATFYALASTYGFLTPELWRETVFTKSPLQEYSGELSWHGQVALPDCHGTAGWQCVMASVTAGESSGVAELQQRCGAGGQAVGSVAAGGGGEQWQ